MVKSRVGLGIFFTILILGGIGAARLAVADWAAPPPTQAEAQAQTGQNELFWRYWTEGVNVSETLSDKAIFPTFGLASDNEAVYLAWGDERDGQDNIYYVASPDGGRNWGTVQPLIQTAQNSSRPSLVVSGTMPYFVWAEALEGDPINRATMLMPLGASQPISIPNDHTRFASTPRLAQGDDGSLHLALQGGQSNQTDVLYTSWRPGLTTWPPASVVVTHTAIGAGNPAIAVDGQTIHLVWQEKLSPNDSRIYYMRGQREGSNVAWETPTPLSDEAYISVRPAIALGEGTIHVAWGEQTDSDKYRAYLPILLRATSLATPSNIGRRQTTPASPDQLIPLNRHYVRHTWFDIEENRWAYPKRINRLAMSTNNIAPTDIAPALVAGPSGVVCLAWHGFYLGVATEAEEIYVTCSTDRGNRWGPLLNVSKSTDLISIRPAMALGQDGTLHVAWQELASPTADPKEEYQVYYTRSLPYVNLLPIIHKSQQ